MPSTVLSRDLLISPNKINRPTTILSTKSEALISQKAKLKFERLSRECRWRLYIKTIVSKLSNLDTALAAIQVLGDGFSLLIKHASFITIQTTIGLKNIAPNKKAFGVVKPEAKIR